jgi:hypothetical protein
MPEVDPEWKYAMRPLSGRELALRRLAREVEAAHERLDDLQLPRVDERGRGLSVASRLHLLPLRQSLCADGLVAPDTRVRRGKETSLSR